MQSNSPLVSHRIECFQSSLYIDGNYLAIGSHDNNIYIYAVSENGRKYLKQGKCIGHSSFITHIDWSVDGHVLQSNSGDYEILYCECCDFYH